MNPDTQECFDTAASMLAAATGCQPSAAQQIVEMIALGTIRWNSEQDRLARQQGEVSSSER